MLGISGLAELRERLARVRVEEVMTRALAGQAAEMAEAVRAGLSMAPGSGGHERPWMQSGALRESVGFVADGLHAVVGSSAAAAAAQEMGTARMPARPFLAPVGAAMGAGVARAVGEAVAGALREGETGATLDRAGLLSSAIQLGASTGRT